MNELLLGEIIDRIVAIEACLCMCAEIHRNKVRQKESPLGVHSGPKHCQLHPEKTKKKVRFVEEDFREYLEKMEKMRIAEELNAHVSFEFGGSGPELKKVVPTVVEVD